jgi:hypothetical protein
LLGSPHRNENGWILSHCRICPAAQKSSLPRSNGDGLFLHSAATAVRTSCLYSSFKYRWQKASVFEVNFHVFFSYNFRDRATVQEVAGKLACAQQGRGLRRLYLLQSVMAGRPDSGTARMPAGAIVIWDSSSPVPTWYHPKPAKTDDRNDPPEVNGLR